MHHSDQYNDTPYNGSRLAHSIPSMRSSVFRARELSPDPLKPPSFVSPDGILPPLAFKDAAECNDIRWARIDYGLAIERTEPIYRDPLPGCSMMGDFKDTIISYFTGADLAALALVDKDCRQLARTRQFRSVLINFSSASMELLSLLLQEARAGASVSVRAFAELPFALIVRERRSWRTIAIGAGIWHGNLEWNVDHQTLRRLLCPLKQLRWLALTRDSYTHGNEYLDSMSRPGDGNEHQGKMVELAGLFAASHPSLEWIYFGQIAMTVGRIEEVRVVTLGEQKNLWSLLAQMWGQYRANWVDDTKEAWAWNSN
ncbi:hypothetical protein Q9L58_001498 [Maublancomyces gigas]|uniref:F-box domain-containing protein n=1 Tax=Discina gigas TaxID=1032678 RepID=A0ABR3GU58_9PEZI